MGRKRLVLAPARWQRLTRSHRHVESYPRPGPDQLDPSPWPAWTDADRWELGPEADPVSPYTAEEAEWWDEQTRDDDPIGDEADADDPAYHGYLDRLAEEREAEDRLCRGLLC